MQFIVAGWASVPIDATVEAEDIESVGTEQAREALADAIESMDEDEIRDRLKTGIEHTYTEAIDG